MGAASSILNEDFNGVYPMSSSSARLRVVHGLEGKVTIANGVQNLVKGVLETIAIQSSLSKTPSETSMDNRSEISVVTKFMDSVHISQWLSEKESSSIFKCLAAIGDKCRPKNTALSNRNHSKYPLWTKYYGLQRLKDGARALDCWGSYHESWIRVEEPPVELAILASRIRSTFNLPNESVNSMVVNFYYDGDSTYIPAHRDTVACLEAKSQIFCLSLGAARDFILCDNLDAGKFEKADLSIVKAWRVRQGDLFALGQQTNEAYCHAVTREEGLSDMRISIIFRSVDKSFINFKCAEKIATYKDGRKKPFQAEWISTKGYDDVGTKHHIADLISEREESKRRTTNLTPSTSSNEGFPAGEAINSEKRQRYEAEMLAQNLKSSEPNAQANGPLLPSVLQAYYMGQGVAVPTKEDSFLQNS